MEYPTSFEECKAYAMGLFKARSHIQDSDIMSLVEYRFSFSVVQYRLTKYQCELGRTTEDNLRIQQFEHAFPELSIVVKRCDIRHKLCPCISQEEYEKNLALIPVTALALAAEPEIDRSTLEELIDEQVPLETHGTVSAEIVESVIDEFDGDDPAVDMFTYENSSHQDSINIEKGEDFQQLGDHSAVEVQMQDDLPVFENRDSSTIIIFDDLPNEITPEMRSDESKCAAALIALKEFHDKKERPPTSRRTVRGSLIYDYGRKMTRLRVHIDGKVFTMPSTIDEDTYLQYLQHYRQGPAERDFDLYLVFYWWVLKHNERVELVGGGR